MAILDLSCIEDDITDRWIPLVGRTQEERVTGEVNIVVTRGTIQEVISPPSFTLFLTSCHLRSIFLLLNTIFIFPYSYKGQEAIPCQIARRYRYETSFSSSYPRLLLVKSVHLTFACFNTHTNYRTHNKKRKINARLRS